MSNEARRSIQLAIKCFKQDLVYQEDSWVTPRYAEIEIKKLEELLMSFPETSE